jgi:hypothetical protein
MKNPNKWHVTADQLPTNCASIPFVFVVGDQEIEGWRIFSWDKKIHQFVQERVGGGWIYYKDEDVKRWRYYGVNRTVTE